MTKKKQAVINNARRRAIEKEINLLNAYVSMSNSPDKDAKLAKIEQLKEARRLMAS